MRRSSSLQVLLLITVTCLSSTLLVLSKERCDPRDKRVLLQIKKEFNSPSLEKAWDPLEDCCNWEIIRCGAKTNRVDYFYIDGELDLPRPTPIPPSIAKLPYLDFLTLRNIRNLIGPIPPSFVHLKRLENLAIKETNVSGPIPQFLSQLKRLHTLELSGSHFSGLIPASLSRLKNMRILNLAENSLSGPIPESFGSFSKLDSLFLYSNRLSGQIPASFPNLNATNFDLSFNRLEGDASMLFGSNKQTGDLRLSGNKFAFDLGKVDLPKDLWVLFIDHNSIYGTLPKDLALTHLVALNVSHNYLCGQIPQGDNLKQFDSSSYANNKCLCGLPLPPCRN